MAEPRRIRHSFAVDQMALDTVPEGYRERFPSRAEARAWIDADGNYNPPNGGMVIERMPPPKPKTRRPNLGPAVWDALWGKPLSIDEIATVIGARPSLVHGTVHALHGAKRIRRATKVPERWERGDPTQP